MKQILARSSMHIQLTSYMLDDRVSGSNPSLKTTPCQLKAITRATEHKHHGRRLARDGVAPRSSDCSSRSARATPACTSGPTTIASTSPPASPRAWTASGTGRASPPPRGRHPPSLEKGARSCSYRRSLWSRPLALDQSVASSRRRLARGSVWRPPRPPATATTERRVQLHGRVRTPWSPAWPHVSLHGRAVEVSPPARPRRCCWRVELKLTANGRRRL